MLKYCLILPLIGVSAIAVSQNELPANSKPAAPMKEAMYTPEQWKALKEKEALEKEEYQKMIEAKEAAYAISEEKKRQDELERKKLAEQQKTKSSTHTPQSSSKSLKETPTKEK